MSEDVGIFGLLVGSMRDAPAHLFPRADAEDLQNGASYIPDEVTDARRSGQEVTFVQAGDPSEWFWKMPDGAQIKHRP